MELLRMAAMKEANINPINGSVGNGASGSSVVFIGVVVCRLGWLQLSQPASHSLLLLIATTLPVEAPAPQRQHRSTSTCLVDTLP